MSQLNWGELIQEAAASGGNYEPLVDGDYELKVLESEVKLTQTGKTMFKVKAEVQSGPNARRFLWDNLVVSDGNPTALGIFFSKMGALGLGKEFFSQSPSNEQIAQAMLNRPFRATIGSRIWNGEKRNEFKRYLPAAMNVPTSAPAPAFAAPAPAPAPAAAPAPAVAPLAAAVPLAAPAPAPAVYQAPAVAPASTEVAPPPPPF